mmetsp:Transcript_12348/g.18977  ORF Transcript_12348/g.18977 Transcript_12348/m.18977 type:complete len:285 (-) Transcript_12348:16-870(-)
MTRSRVDHAHIMLFTRNKKRLYLLNEPEFVRELLIWLAAMSVFVVAFVTVRQEQALILYYQIQDWMLQLAHSYAWWSVVGLLSSSCCAIQLILNAMSVGCAGFNTTIGPWRPMLMATTLMLQVVTWYVRIWVISPWQPSKVSLRSSIFSTTIVLFLTLMPEILAYGTFLKKTFYEKPSNASQSNNSKIALETNVPDISDENRRQHALLEFTMDSVGCSACLATVTHVMNSIILQSSGNSFTTSMEKLSVIVNDHENKEKLKRKILEKLADAGFPAKSVEEVKVD